MAWVKKITAEGKAMEAAAYGKTINFVEAKCGSGIVDESLLESQTAVSDYRKNLAITSIGSLGATTKLRLQLSNADLTTGFDLHMIGIFAKLGTDGNVQLHTVLQNTVADPIPSAAESPEYTNDYVVNITVNNAASISAILTPAAYVTVGQIQEINNAISNINTQLINFDCGNFDDDDDPVATHNVAVPTHTGITVDGNANGISTSDSLLEHEADPNAHPNLSIDGNI